MGNINILKEKMCWVIFRFPDDSIIFIQSTLNPDLLNGKIVKENSLYDFYRDCSFPLDLVKDTELEIFHEKPNIREVDLFANKYIR